MPLQQRSLEVYVRYKCGVLERESRVFLNLRIAVIKTPELLAI